MNGLQNNPPGSTLWQASLSPGILTNPFVRQGSSPRLPVCKHPAEEEPMSADNKSIVRLLYDEVWNKRRLELVDEIISPSHALHDPNLTGSAVGPEAYKRQVARFITAFPDLRFTAGDIVGEKVKLAVAWTISGTHKGEFMGIPATNKKVSVDGITINHILNGKIMDSYISWDAWGAMQQLGVVPALGQTKSLTAR